MLKILSKLWPADSDVLAEYRQELMTHFSLLVSLLLLPFLLINLWQGKLLVAAATGSATLVMATLSFFLLRNTASSKQHLDSGGSNGEHSALTKAVSARLYFLVSLLLMAAVMTSTFNQGLQGSFWAYPTVFFFYFALSRRLALILGCLFVVAMGVVCFKVMGTGMAIRVIATLCLTQALINMVLNVVGILRKELEQQAITDPLTGAYNRRYLQNRLNEIQAGQHNRAASRHNDLEQRGRSHAILSIDVDHFKAINDTYGHEMGDRILRGMVTIVSARKRQSDILFRTGGEEFVLLLQNCTQSDAMNLAEHLRQSIEAAPLLPNRLITVSIGVGFRLPGENPQNWFKRTDNALYDAKHAGRNRVSFAG
ncbi:MAG: GGDEF domain-containing protein [Rhizobacter sp.]